MIKKVCAESGKGRTGEATWAAGQTFLSSQLSSGNSCPLGEGVLRGGVSSRTYFIQGSVVDPRPLPRTWWVLGMNCQENYLVDVCEMLA